MFSLRCGVWGGGGQIPAGGTEGGWTVAALASGSEPALMRSSAIPHTGERQTTATQSKIKKPGTAARPFVSIISGPIPSRPHQHSGTTRHRAAKQSVSRTIPAIFCAIKMTFYTRRPNSSHTIFYSFPSHSRIPCSKADALTRHNQECWFSHPRKGKPAGKHAGLPQGGDAKPRVSSRT